ncbi:MAG TPA: HEAT repeat domain-containing protein [Thermoanaerobaculia bacterium]|nr:HEAT repeat domain-containing protein [Thermoanaerobaculia bacterium]
MAWRFKLPLPPGPTRAWLEVRLESSTSLESGTTIVVVIPGPPGFFKVKIRREQPQLREMSEIEIGDAAFDTLFFIEGPAPLVFALLDAEMRSLLLRVNVECRLEISIGALWADVSDPQVPGLLPLLLEVAGRLARPLNVVQGLARNAREDPEEGVRLRNLLCLVREFPRTLETLEALRNACSDPNPEIRLRAAQERGDAGRAVLLKFAGDPLEVDSVSAGAVSLLKRDLSFDLMKTFLEQALRRRRFQTARICLEALGQSRDAAAVDLLAKVLAREQGELADAAAEALEKTGSPAAEAPLIRALERERPETRMAAVKALGRVGSPAAVLPLKDAAERFPDRELRRATRQAIAEIQARLPGATPGQLSLTGAEEGQLSFAEAEAGQLSLAADPGGQVSLSEDEEEMARKPGPAPAGSAGILPASNSKK